MLEEAMMRRHKFPLSSKSWMMVSVNMMRDVSSPTASHYSAERQFAQAGSNCTASEAQNSSGVAPVQEARYQAGACCFQCRTSNVCSKSAFESGEDAYLAGLAASRHHHRVLKKRGSNSVL